MDIEHYFHFSTDFPQNPLHIHQLSARKYPQTCAILFVNMEQHLTPAATNVGGALKLSQAVVHACATTHKVGDKTIGTITAA
jgi:hypothetical protein